MRASSNKDDPGYINLPRVRGGRIFLDGVERTRVVTADEEKRLIVRFKTDEAGKVMLTADRKVIQTETLFGDVRIEPPCVKLVHAHHR